MFRAQGAWGSKLEGLGVQGALQGSWIVLLVTIHLSTK